MCKSEFRSQNSGVRTDFAFLRTRVDANWGTTGAVHCIRAEQIADYVTKSRGGNSIPPADIPRLISAAKALKETIATTKEPRT
jgi:hypothetical protein